MMRKRSGRVAFAALAVAFGLAGCDPVDGTRPGTGRDPRAFDAWYQWFLQDFSQGAPVGYPAVELTWDVPAQYSNEVFRVYARRSSGGGYGLIATVTSCSGGICRYRDTNVSGGQSYDYYIATYDDRTGVELGTSEALRVAVLQRPNLSAPANPSAVSLDQAVFLKWPSTNANLYLVLAQQDNGTIYRIGETDGLTFLDTRAENGSTYRYWIASVDQHGHASSLSQAALGYPRPDYFSEVIYVHLDNPAASGFRFVTSETLDPVVSGTATNAQWRLDFSGGVYRIQPLGSTAITAGSFTTSLTCGAGSDADCVDIRNAPGAVQFGTSAVPVQTGFTYVLRVTGADNRTHFGKIRVQGTTVDNQGRRLMVFDWAYQLRPDETSLDVRTGAATQE